VEREREREKENEGRRGCDSVEANSPKTSIRFHKFDVHNAFNHVGIR